ncbi:MAG: hypothetical protein QNJ44_00515 [Rhodobacter sp.]|nr:hypothetical protein [Rhodobacter sp.]
MRQLFPDWGWDIATPSIIYFMDGFRRSARLFVEICDTHGITCSYAVKANRHPRILAAAAQEGLGFDIASHEEFRTIDGLRARAILATSPGLTKETMAAVDDVSGTIFFDNLAQFDLAREIGLDTRDHGIRLSMPGDYAAFGFAAGEMAGLRDRGIPVKKVHVHAGEYFDQADVERRLQHLRAIVEHVDLDVIDLGGGFGVLSNRRESLETALSTMKRFSNEMGTKLIIEPGKAIAARCGFLVATVLASKARPEGQVVIIDSSSFNLGEMEVRRLAATSAEDTSLVLTTVIGPTCFEGDIWGQFDLPRLAPGDRLIFSNMGAYTASIAATLHGLPAPGEHFID